jgi:predicted nucleic acid-binding protein
VIVIDTSVLVDALTGLKRSGSKIRSALAEDETILLPALVLYEWLRGPRIAEELALQESLFPAKSAIPFDTEEATSQRRCVSGPGPATCDRSTLSSARRRLEFR